MASRSLVRISDFEFRILRLRSAARKRVGLPHEIVPFPVLVGPDRLAIDAGRNRLGAVSRASFRSGRGVRHLAPRLVAAPDRNAP